MVGGSMLGGIYPAGFVNFDVIPQNALQTIKENFNDNSLAAIWASYGNAAETNQQLELTSDLTAAYHGINTVDTYSLLGSYAQAEIIDEGDLSLDSWEVYPVYLELDADNAVFWVVSGFDDSVTAFKIVGASQSSVFSDTFNLSTYKFLRIREDSGTTYWEYSSTGLPGSWSTAHSESNPFTLASLELNVYAGTWDTELSTTVAIIDNVNIFNYTQSLSVGIDLADLLTRDTSKLLQDTIAISDGIAKSITKPITETIEIAVTIDREGVFYRTFVETVALADSAVKLVSKTFSETVKIYTRYLRHLNGIFIDFWTRVARQATNWTGVAKEDTNWTNEEKQTTNWTKTNKEI